MVLCSGPALAAGKAEINYARDGKVIAAAGRAQLAGKPPTTAVNQAGFATKKSNRRVTQYRKDAGGGLLPTYLILNMQKKPNNPAFRGCNFVLSLPKRLLALTIPPEPQAALKALRTALKSNRYKQGRAKNAFGGQQETWTRPDGTTYKLELANSGAVYTFTIVPK